MGRHSTLDYVQKQTRALHEKPLDCYDISIIWVLAACRREPQIQLASFQAGPAIWPTSPDMYTRPAGIFTTFIYPRGLSIHRFDAPVPTIHSTFLSFQGEKNGLAIFIVDPGLLRPGSVADLRHRKAGEAVMTFFYIVGAITAVLLMVYLVIALLKPELFS
jgi:K+-transporting ATPase KdpF subunit